MPEGGSWNSSGRAEASNGRGGILNGSLITRFAPAPTGHLHLGHVVNALYVWGAARQAGGSVLLRIEDHDRQRSRPEYEASILEDLAWLGFVHDGPVVRQSERDSLYRAALQPLIDRGLAYGCTCTRTDLAAGAPYPGTCRDKGIALTDGVGWRVRFEAGDETFVDALKGLQVQDPSLQSGDLLIKDRLNNWTYQFAVTVDDYRQGITDVIRGEDLLDSTGRQIRLARMLGREAPPRFSHHPLVMKTAQQKLSKSDGDTGIRDLRAAGRTAEAVLDLARKAGNLPL